MSIYSNVTEQDLDNLRKIAEQQKNQRALKIKKRILKQTHDEKLAESLCPITEPITKKLDEVSEIIKKSQPSQNIKTILQNSENQTPAIEIIGGTQSLRDTLTHMKGSKNFFKLVEKPDGKVYWNNVRVKPVRENTIDIIGREYDVTPNIQHYFRKTGFTTKFLNDNEKETVYNILEDVGFYDKRHTKGLKSSRHKDALYNLPKAIDKIRNPPLPSIENVETSTDLEGRGVKIIIPSNIIDIYTRFEFLLGLKLSNHTDTLTEASNSIDDLYKRGKIQNKQQYRNALNIFSN